ncbi:hypothetical protein IE53DRAFT_388151 [Violaceomyces palustris]|uniref:Uncharacterized protein n=1 Tax=Violaceomyces palustris TaxID=1673888 RepID=A0ACD0NUT5_9BASI|nr:hypothetical protein IE53DRAFT_388151 [Violaceomyces palustris]
MAARISYHHFKLAINDYLDKNRRPISTSSASTESKLGAHLLSNRWRVITSSPTPFQSNSAPLDHLSRTFSLPLPLGYQRQTIDPILSQLSAGIIPSEYQEPAQTQEARQLVTVDQSILWSPTWQVPVLHFSASWQDGSPLSLTELLESPVFVRSTAFDPTSVSQDPGESCDLPQISQGEHPVTGRPSWFLHPCHTAELLSQILGAPNPDPELLPILESDRRKRPGSEYIEAFMMMLSSDVQMRVE